MPLFMMMSGYFSLRSMASPPQKTLKKKFIQLILPTVSWVIVLGAIFLFYKIIDTAPLNWVKSINETLVYSLREIVDTERFWFLKTCFCCYLLAYCGSHIIKNKSLWIIVTVIVSQRIPHICQIDIMYPCFIVGMLLNYSQRFFELACKNRLILLGIFLIMLCFWDQAFWGQEGYLKNYLSTWTLTSNQLFIRVFCKLYRLLIGIVGSLAFIGIVSDLIPQGKSSKSISLLCNWGQYTLGVYLLQSIIVELLLAKYICLDDMNYYVSNFIFIPLMSIGVLVLCVFVVKLIGKSPRFTFFFLGTNK